MTLLNEIEDYLNQFYSPSVDESTKMMLGIRSYRLIHFIDIELNSVKSSFENSEELLIAINARYLLYSYLYL